jgi:hypothetical protein
MVCVGFMVQDEGRPIVMVVNVYEGAPPFSWGKAATMELSREISAASVREDCDECPGANHNYLRSRIAIDLKDCMMMMPE